MKSYIHFKVEKKMKQMKKLWMVAMLCMMGTFSGWAQSGDTGVLHWELVDGTLTISGTGAMPDYGYSGSPWYVYRNQIEQVVIENGVTSIGKNAFSECNWFISIAIPESVTSIGDYAFYQCSDLTSIIIPESVTNIGIAAFGRCSNLMSIEVENANLSYMSENGVLFNKEKTILVQCPGRKSGAYTIPNSVTNIGGAAFTACTYLTSITIPDSVTSIEADVFRNCTSLTSITIPNSVSSIGSGAFCECSSLISVTISNNVISIESEVFRTCTSLTSITIPNGVTSIGNSAFDNCTSLTSVTIPNGVTSIGNMAFSRCPSLISITNLNTIPQVINSSVFDRPFPLYIGVNFSDATLYVPAGSKSAYESATIWKDFGQIIEIVVPPYYTPVTQPYASTMTFVATAVLDGLELQSDKLEIGAFSGSECRGSIMVQNYPEVMAHPYLGFLVVHGNGGEEITFKVYDYDTEREYEATNAPVDFTADAIYGSPAAPYPVTLTEAIMQTIPLVEGWSWISVNVSGDALPLLDQFKENIGGVGVLLKGRNEFIQTPGWLGTLTGINNTDMYMVNTTATHDLTFFGLPVDPETTPVTLTNGWNWIGYTPQAGLPIGDALADLTPQEGDEIKSRTNYSIYTSGNWVGILDEMNPGYGYKYYSANASPQTWVYPSTSTRSNRSGEAETLR